MTEQANELLQRGIAAARAGEKAQARQLLQDAVKRDPRNELTWLWLSSVSEDPRERLFCLRKVLEINPNNDHAIKGIQKYGSEIAAEGAGSPTINTSPTVPTASPMPINSSPVPRLSEAKLQTPLAQIESVVSKFSVSLESALPITWQKKNRGRIGDAAAARFRLIVGVSAAAILVALGGLLLFISSYILNPEYVVINQTIVPAPTITPSPTSTQGFAPSPSPTPQLTLTPSTTPDFPRGELGATSTPVFPELGDDRESRQIEGLLGIGKYAEALEILEAARKGEELKKSDRYYVIVYYMTIAEIALGRPGRAQSLLDSNVKVDSPYYQAGVASTLFAVGQDEEALNAAREALILQPRMVTAVVVTAKVYAKRGEFANARSALDGALKLGSLRQNVDLVLARAEVNRLDGKYADALNDAQLALYINPVNRAAFIERCEILITKAAAVAGRSAQVQAYGEAVLAAQEFLFYYPGDTSGWRVLGQAREGEGNITAALDAYAQGIVSDQLSEDARAILLARAALALNERRFVDAQKDAEAAEKIRSGADARSLRLNALLGAGDFVTALSEVNTLLNDAPEDSGLLVTKLDLLIGARLADKLSPEAFVADFATVTDAFIAPLTTNQQAIAYLYRGMAVLETPNSRPDAIQAALLDLNNALARRDTGAGHFYRGLAYEKLGNLNAAITNYQWVLFLDGTFPLSYAGNAREREAAVETLLPPSTATLTPTATATNSPTPTSTAIPTLTRTFTPTRTLPPTRTVPPTRTLVPTRTPRVSPTARP